MNIRIARDGDTEGLLSLLSQVLEVHHSGRPDLFKGGCVKYTREELSELLKDPSRPVFVAVDESERVLGYCFCIFKRETDSNILTDIKTLYIDDLCVDSASRGCRVGSSLYRYVRDFARREGFYNITLNVWALNGPAVEFYERMGLHVQKLGMEELL